MNNERISLYEVRNTPVNLRIAVAFSHPRTAGAVLFIIREGADIGSTSIPILPHLKRSRLEVINESFDGRIVYH